MPIIKTINLTSEAESIRKEKFGEEGNGNFSGWIQDKLLELKALDSDPSYIKSKITELSAEISKLEAKRDSWIKKLSFVNELCNVRKTQSETAQNEYQVELDKIKTGLGRELNDNEVDSSIRKLNKGFSSKEVIEEIKKFEAMMAEVRAKSAKRNKTEGVQDA